MIKRARTARSGQSLPSSLRCCSSSTRRPGPRDITKSYLRTTSIQDKIELVKNHWPDKIPAEAVKEVRRLIENRNRLAHAKGTFRTANETPHGTAEMQNHRLTGDEMWHMLDHYKIAHDFLSRFWMPGTREASQGLRASPTSPAQ
jgi:hypothetical protein